MEALFLHCPRDTCKTISHKPLLIMRLCCLCPSFFSTHLQTKRFACVVHIQMRISGCWCRIFPFLKSSGSTCHPRFISYGDANDGNTGIISAALALAWLALCTCVTGVSAPQCSAQLNPRLTGWSQSATVVCCVPWESRLVWIGAGLGLKLLRWPNYIKGTLGRGNVFMGKAGFKTCNWLEMPYRYLYHCEWLENKLGKDTVVIHNSFVLN